MRTTPTRNAAGDQLSRQRRRHRPEVALLEDRRLLATGGYLELSGFPTDPVVANADFHYTIDNRNADGSTNYDKDYLDLSATPGPLRGYVGLPIQGSVNSINSFDDPGRETITIQAESDPTLKLTASVLVLPAALDHYVITETAPTGGDRAGVASTFTVTAYDTTGNVATLDDEAFTIGDSDSQSVVAPASGNLVAGQATIQVTPESTGMHTLTFTGSFSTPGTTFEYTVGAGLTRHLELTGLPATVTAGTSVPVVVTSVDQFGNVATDDTSTVDVDPGTLAVGPIPVTLVDGTATANVVLTTAGTASLTASSSDGTETGSAGPVTVTPAAATHLMSTTTAAEAQVAGTEFQVTVTALDAFGNVATAFNGPITVTSTDSQAALPTGAALADGTATFLVTLKTAGTIGVTVADAGGSLPSITTSTVVVPAAVTFLQLTGPIILPVNQPTLYTLTAFDAYNNKATNSTNVIQLTGSDAGVTLPPTLTIDSGVAIFMVTYTTAGPHMITVATATDPTVTTTLTAAATTTVTGTVFVDLSGTGVRTAADPVLAERTIYLDLNGNGQLDATEPTAVTNAAGQYTFTAVGAAVTSSMVRQALNLDPSLRSSQSRATTNGDGTIDLAVTIEPPVAPVAVTTGLLPVTASSDPSTAYVESLYRSVLGRNGSGEEVDDWLTLIAAQGPSRDEIAAMFVASVEHRQQEVASFYQQFLGRTPDPTASYWVNAFRGGETEAQVARGILNSTEYQSAHPTINGLVDSLYNDVLARQADPMAAETFAALGATAPDLVATFVESAEAHAQAVASFYAVFLHRQPEDGPSAAYWTDLLNSGAGSISDVAVGILGSDEYLQEARAGRA